MALPTIVLWLLVLVVGLGLFPLARRVFPDDAGTAWAASKYLGFLPALFLLWMSIQAGPGRVSREWCWALLLVTVAAAWWSEYRAGTIGDALRTITSRDNVLTEILFAVLLGLLAWVLHFNPAVDPDTERFMDYALLETVVSGHGFPLQDPWFAGEPLQYYYFGYYWVGCALALAGIDTLTGFVPIVALVYALFGLLLYTFGKALRGRPGDGLLALFLVLASGNLKSWLTFLREPALAGFDWFSPSRAIPGTINEFPWFSFLWGDLHPYVVGFPLFALMLLLILEAYRHGMPSWRSPRFAVTAGALGLSASINSWDFPSMAMLLAIALYHHRAAEAVPRLRAAGSALGATALVSAVGLAPFLPYLVLFQAGGRRLAWVSRPSAWSDYLAVHGTHWIVLLSCAIAAMLAAHGKVERRWSLVLLLGVAGSIFAGSVAAGAVVFAVLAWLLAEKSPASGPGRLGWAMVAGSMLLTASVEILYVDDIFKGKTERIVTVFKVYLQTWIILSAACVLLLASLAGRFAFLRRSVVAALLVIGAVYPVAGTVARIHSLGDSWIYTTREHLMRDLGEEYRAVTWLAENAAPGEVVLEAPDRPYTWSGRLAAFTPVSTPLAWGRHQATWRNSWQLVRERRADVDRLFTGTDLDETRALLSKYRVRYVMVGRLERERYGDPALAKFDRMGESVIDAGGVRLIRLLAPPD